VRLTAVADHVNDDVLSIRHIFASKSARVELFDQKV
jgi:hypothetical protein